MNILIYKGEGVGPIAFKQTMNSLKEASPTFASIRAINSAGLLEEAWEETASLLVFPGGRALPYHTHLKGAANHRIRSYVSRGGTYLGLCAGAYYGASHVEFEKGHPLEVCGSRELAFFPGVAKGPAYGPRLFRYKSEKGSRVAKVDTVGAWIHSDSEPFHLYYNGGCYFESAEQHSNVAIFARYADLPGSPAALVRCEVEKGQAFLCGVHPEYPFTALNLLDPYSRTLLPSLSQGDLKRRLFWNALISTALKSQCKNPS